MNICTTCGYIGNPTRQTKGSFGVEIVLWLFFIIPGLIYSIWRLSSKQSVCPACKNPTLIPANTPKGQELYEAAKQKSPALIETAQKDEEKALKVKIVLIAILVILGVIIINAILKF